MSPSSPFRIAAAAVGALLAATPALRAQPATPPVGPTVSLPPFLVQDAGGPAWRYASVPGFEFLSHWSDSRTESFALGVAAAKQLFEAILPPDYQVQLSTPTAYVLVTEQSTDALSQNLVTQELAHSQTADADSGRRTTQIGFLPNFMLWDWDDLIVYALEPPHDRGTTLIFSNERVFVGLERRTPALPRWFIDGFRDLYSGMDFSQGAAATGTAGWTTREATAALAADPEAPRKLLPLAELFANPPAGGPNETQEHAFLRQAEASLFIRWTLDGDNHPRRAALWQWLNGAVAGPVTERRFQELFGEGYSAALNDLSDYLPWALTHSLRLTTPLNLTLTEVRMRDATAAEVGRIKGDWERLEMHRVAAQFPTLVPKYREHARKTLDFAYQVDKGDPGLLAVKGLFDLECNDPVAAQPLLEAAAAGRVVRPRVYFELARLQLSQAIKALPDLPSARLAPEQTAQIFSLLDRARAQSPALAQVYGLYYEVWQVSAGQPTTAQLQVFRDSARLFSENPPLMYEAAVMLARSGELDSAKAVVDRGLATPTNTAMQSRLENLRDQLAAALQQSAATAPAKSL
jgi:hypothetical protein